jgi:uncharacterized membrane protein
MPGASRWTRSRGSRPTPSSTDSSTWRHGSSSPSRRASCCEHGSAGWGAFNLVEGLIDHQLLGLHHVRDDLGGPLGWDIAFLASGVLLIAVGAALVRTSALDVERAQ